MGKRDPMLSLFLFLTCVHAIDRPAGAPDIEERLKRKFGKIELPPKPDWAWWEDTVNPSLASPLCKEFYDERQEIEDGRTHISVLGKGGQSIVYKCETTYEYAEVPAVAEKLYRRPYEFNMTERMIIDTTIGKNDIGNEVYKFFWNEETYKNPKSKDPAGKFEALLTGKSLDEHYELFNNKTVYRKVAEQMARVHALSYDKVPTVIKYDTEIWPWNTKLVKEHLNQPWFWQYHEGAHEILGVNTTMQEEIHFADQKVQQSTDKIYFCHNDLHQGNVMADFNENEEILADTLQLIDFDNAAWGYRAFDIVYHFVHYTFYPVDAKQEDFLIHYIAEYNRLSEEKVTLNELLREIKDHEPYVLLEQIIFYRTMNLNHWPAVKQYCETMTQYYKRPIECGKDIPDVPVVLPIPEQTI